MLSWYRRQIATHGPVAATHLLCRVAWSRTRVNAANKLLPEKLECPCCGWRGRRLYDYIEAEYLERNIACPVCDSHPRHRALTLWLRTEYRLEAKHGVALLFAPEKALAPIWGRSALNVYTVDLEAARRPHLQGDLTHLPIASNSVDLLWCHHVLEHVKDDRAAIEELSRVLRPGSGELIVSVPMHAEPRTTEYERVDGLGHWRMYGDDFTDRLEDSGFKVQPVVQKLSARERERYGIWPEPFYICRKGRTVAGEGPALRSASA